jgi:hypothetical protein
MSELDKFIGVYPNALSDHLCNEIIKTYNTLDEVYLTNRQICDRVPKLEKDNNFTFIADWENTSIGLNKSREILKEFQNVFWNNCYPKYADKLGILASLNEHGFYDTIKIQKTIPGEGYHVWHCEHGSISVGNRLLLVIAYLNDVEEGGETEFLYQGIRVPARKGTILICPAGFTHTHRGNPPLKGTKYILNGWLEFRT